jgi:hypothetical protein
MGPLREVDKLSHWCLTSLRGRLEEQVARTADFVVRVFSVALIATVPYSIAVSKLRRPFFSIDISLSSCACSGGERDSPSLISPCWREPSTERGHCTLFT